MFFTIWFKVIRIIFFKNLDIFVRNDFVDEFEIIKWDKSIMMVSKDDMILVLCNYDNIVSF